MGTVRLAGYTFDLDPSTASWGCNIKTYRGNTQGGEIIQVLRRELDDFSVTGYLSSRGLTPDKRYSRMLAFEKTMTTIMEYHVETGQSVRFDFPILGWTGKVFLKSYDGLSYNPHTSALSYRLNFEIDTGFNTLLSVAARDDLNQIADGVGWERNEYNTPNLDNWDDMLSALKTVVENAGSYDAYGASLYGELQKLRQEDDGFVSTNDGTVVVSVEGGTSSIIDGIRKGLNNATGGSF